MAQYARDNRQHYKVMAQFEIIVFFKTTLGVTSSEKESLKPCVFSLSNYYYVTMLVIINRLNITIVFIQHGKAKQYTQNI